MQQKEPHLDLALRLARGHGQAAARQSLDRMAPHEWAILVEYSLAVICLEESVRPERVHLIPAANLES